MKEHAAIVIRNEKGEILFCQRSKLKRVLPLAWAFPSGTKEKDEDIFNTAKREAFEELGVKVTPKSIMCTKELPEFGDKLYFVICEIESGEVYIKEPDEIEALLWLSFEDFFEKFTDNQIGHGLIYLRNNPDFWKETKGGEK